MNFLKTFSPIFSQEKFLKFRMHVKTTETDFYDADYNGTRAYDHLVRKRTFNHIGQFG